MYVQGKNSILYIKWNDEWVPISCEVSNSMAESSNMVDTTTRDNKGWTTSRPNTQSYSISFSGHTIIIPQNNILNYFNLVKLKRDRELIEWERRIEGTITEFGKAYISDIGNNYESEGFAIFDMTLTGFGKPDFMYENGVLVDYNYDAITDENNNAIYTE